MPVAHHRPRGTTMPEHVIDRIATLSGNIQEAQRTGRLQDLVGEFTQVLECVPDYPAHAFSAASLGRVNAQSEAVIARIERWIDSGVGDRDDQQRLAGAVYEMRRALEEIDRWQKHYPHA